ncbi:MAG: TlpA disulfide reductase family protein [Bacteroidales bacterium]
MKRTVFRITAILTCLLLLAGCNLSHRAKITGNITGLVVNKVYLTEYNLTHEKIIDSVEVSKKGAFSLRLRLSQPQLYRLYITPNKYVWLLLSPGEKVKLNIAFKQDSFDYEVTGSTFSQQVKMLSDTLQATRKKLNQLEAQYAFAVLKNDNNLQSLQQQYQQVIDRQRKFSIGFLIEHLQSPASIVALYQQLNDSLYVFYKPTDLQYVKILADTLSKYYPQSNIVRVLSTERNRLMEQYQRLRKQQSLLSMEKAEIKAFPEIRLPNYWGDSVSLTASVGKLLLLAFWTPIDPDSRVAMNTFEALYQKYHSKGLELYCVALIEDEGYWKNMVKKLNLPGIQVIEQAGLNSSTVRIYNVQQIPSTVLLSQKGIIAVNIFGDRLEKEIIKNLPQ